MAIHGLAVLAITQLDSGVPKLLDPVEVVLMTPKGKSKTVTLNSKSQPQPVQKMKTMSSEMLEKALPVDVAAITPAAHSPGSSGDTLGESSGTEAGASERYLFEIRALLDRRKTYPRFAKKLRQEGRVLVRLQIRRDGKILSAEVIEKAKFDSLNEAAAALVTAIDGWKPFPEEIKKTVWAIDVPIDYSL